MNDLPQSSCSYWNNTSNYNMPFNYNAESASIEERHSYNPVNLSVNFVPNQEYAYENSCSYSKTVTNKDFKSENVSACEKYRTSFDQFRNDYNEKWCEINFGRSEYYRDLNYKIYDQQNCMGIGSNTNISANSILTSNSTEISGSISSLNKEESESVKEDSPALRALLSRPIKDKKINYPSNINIKETVTFQTVNNFVPFKNEFVCDEKTDVMNNNFNKYENKQDEKHFYPWMKTSTNGN